jgi:flagellar motor switch protein FliM
MEKILSKEEIDTLLNTVFAGGLVPVKELSKGSVNNYDLFNNDVYKGVVPNLDIIYDGFIHYNRATFSNRLRRLVEIKKAGVRSCRFDDFLLSLPSTVCMAIYKIEPLKGAALIAMDSKLVFGVVDSLLGGSGINAEVGDRQFSSIELRLMEKVVRDALLDMEKAWAPLLATRMNLLRMETNPRLVNIVPPEYQVLSMTLEIQLDDVVGSMIFAIPYMTIEPILDKLKPGVQSDMTAIDPHWSNRLYSELVEAPLEVVVELGSSTITLDELMHLEPGDTVMLDKGCCGELLINVAGVEKFRGIPGVQHGNKAVQITKFVQMGVTSD